jgi:hypothetical protein
MPVYNYTTLDDPSIIAMIQQMLANELAAMIRVCAQSPSSSPA